MVRIQLRQILDCGLRSDPCTVRSQSNSKMEISVPIATNSPTWLPGHGCVRWPKSVRRPAEMNLPVRRTSSPSHGATRRTSSPSHGATRRTGSPSYKLRMVSSILPLAYVPFQKQNCRTGLRARSKPAQEPVGFKDPTCENAALFLDKSFANVEHVDFPITISMRSLANFWVHSTRNGEE